MLLRLAFTVVTSILILAGMANGQETDRSGLAVEFPELDSGRIAEVKSYISRADVNVVKFWIMDPAADSIEWNKIKIRINQKSANVACSQMAAAQGKVLKCDLNRFFRFRLNPKENIFEIEAIDRAGKVFYASFRVVTDAAAAVRQAGKNNVSPGTVQRSTLGFSGRKFAVILGVSTYKYNDVGLGNLNYAHADADALYEWLTKKGGFSPTDVLYLTNEKATLSTVRDSLNRFLTKATETDLILFFFAGHGTPDPFEPSKLYYLVHDSKVSDLKTTGFPMIELKQIIDTRLKSKRAIFLLDTCHSAGVSGKKVVALKRENPNDSAKKGSRGLPDDENERILQRVEVTNSVSEGATRLFGSSGRAVLASSDVNETSRESGRWGGGHGVFTWALLEGLGGAADTNGDKTITTDELFVYVRQKVGAETKGKQTPRLLSSLGSGVEIAVLK